METPEKSKLEEWFGERLDTVLDDGSEYPLLLVAVGEKPAALTMNVDKRQVEALSSFCDAFDLEMKVSEGRVSKPSRTVGEPDRKDQRAAFICREKERFELLKPGRFYGYSDRSVGRFLDFPDSAVEFFARSEQPGLESKKRIEELRSEEDLEDVEYLALTTFIPAPEESEIREAIRIGKDREKHLLHTGRGLETSLFNDFIESRKSNSLY